MKQLLKIFLDNRIEKILWIALFWVMISLFQFLTVYSILLEDQHITIQDNTLPYLIVNVTTGLFGGILGGSFLVFFGERWFRTKSYRWSIFNLIWSYTFIYVIVISFRSLVFKDETMRFKSLNEASFQSEEFIIFLISHGQSYFFWLFIVVVTLIALLVNDKYGPGVFKAFILGKYFHPKRERRIFMFLDLRGSTTIAEELGEADYFNLLKDLFKDITPSVLKAKGEIYQYVGDEVVISWKEKVGLHEANCIQCFFDIQQTLNKKSQYYKSNYNDIAPKFKAGFHSGAVMVGELGIVKREIVYSGDVLNTAARIQAQCNEFGVDILLSKHLLNGFQSLPSICHSRAMGEIHLRGKQESITLYTV